ncbi:50S ribosomal protein L29 [Anaplasma marginale]|uniref:Large ribosomal subunit protein uL29 n=2 Tax=Anaplasma marginale TaxID=770 RepID=B9KJ62_ANAMF|nr:50S ribosomal protein L29 [Anaplasma marginale]AAV86814.1 50S ribosomal protein L29 [Anaplasma marginale str. St. Maries]ACM49524.1 50S ribosomal protein L29 (rpmC) [Anaplasma marginale str. Florida]AGZ79019.1 50S ribosomal protein L29 [Anaplasma marginale str. Gypsy Plains]AXW84226.1 50S ribosomal protein L29 [Anaplasma marginale]AXW85150.1 50S ribosomal protein L29 [Anaplasma marginale]
MGSSVDMKGQSSKELREKLASLRRDLVAQVFESKEGSSTSSVRRSAIKKEIARVLTTLSWRRVRGDDV